MKKALVLGIMAFFAINIATVQNANAKVKTDNLPTITTTTVEPDTITRTPQSATAVTTGKSRVSEAPLPSTNPSTTFPTESLNNRPTPAQTNQVGRPANNKLSRRTITTTMDSNKDKKPAENAGDR